MIRAFRYALRPTKAQEAVLEHWVEMCRLLYNAALQQRRDAYRLRGKSLSYMDQTKELTDLRASDSEWADVPVKVERSALSRLHHAFEHFFRRVSQGRIPGYPRFRGPGRYDSFDIPACRIESNRVFLPKLGGVKFVRHRDFKGRVKTITVRNVAGRWYVSLTCDIGPAPIKVPIQSEIGIDLGLTSFAVLSNAEVINNPRFYRHSEQALAGRQRRFSRKRPGSKGRDRAGRLVGQAATRIRQQRQDFAWKLAVSLFRRFDVVVFESLGIDKLTRTRLSKSVNDAAWGFFLHALICKAEEAGKWAVPVDPRGTTKRCSSCGHPTEKTLGDRVHSCPQCGLVLHRDHNAALNILALGRSAVDALAEVPVGTLHIRG